MSMYNSSIPIFVRFLDNLSGLLNSASAYGTDQAIDESVLASARLFPNMHPLIKQVQIACDMVMRGGARLAGATPPEDEDNETTFAELQARIADTKTFLLGLSEENINGSADITIVMPAGPYELTFTGEEYLNLLEKNNIGAVKTTFSQDGITLEKPTDVTALPLFLEGGFSVQDESPQLSAGLLDLESGLTILDACCAPGGKTAHILEQDFTYKKVIGLDVSEQRLQRTADNLSRLTLFDSSIIELKTGDASEPESWWDGEQFDRILLDAPCSATGIIRRQPDIKILRTPDNVAKLVGIQTNILSTLWPLLKPKGILLYATCSILPEENNQIIEQFLKNTPSAEHMPIDADWGIEQAHGVGRQLFPSSYKKASETEVGMAKEDAQSNHDGFYYAKLRKNK